MLLTIDIGNTNTSLGIFDKDVCIDEFHIPSDKELSGEEFVIVLHSLCKEYMIDSCIIASVVNGLDEVFDFAVTKAFNVVPIFVNSSLDCGITVKTDKPEEMGADRIANAVAASNIYDGAVIVADFGTATTLDIVNSKKEFIGGVIAPGIYTQLKSLSFSTSKLPIVQVSESPFAIGTNTQNSILSGVVRGTACMVEGLIKQCEKEMNEKPKIIATGGFCDLVSKYMSKPFDDVNPRLTLLGMYYAYKKNKTSLSSAR